MFREMLRSWGELDPSLHERTCLLRSKLNKNQPSSEECRCCKMQGQKEDTQAPPVVFNFRMPLYDRELLFDKILYMIEEEKQQLIEHSSSPKYPTEEKIKELKKLKYAKLIAEIKRLYQIRVDN